MGTLSTRWTLYADHRHQAILEIDGSADCLTRGTAVGKLAEIGWIAFTGQQLAKSRRSTLALDCHDWHKSNSVVFDARLATGTITQSVESEIRH
jgi:hypothetical protein